MTSKNCARETAGAAEIRKILARVVECVRKLDYDGVREFFPDDGLYFGSYTPVAHGYDEMVERQFSKVWPNISEFTIPSETISVQASDTFAWATCLFESSGTGPDEQAVTRKGRMSFIFERRGTQWVIVHSHDSLFPTPS